MGAEKILILE